MLRKQMKMIKKEIISTYMNYPNKLDKKINTNKKTNVKYF